jgi:hypothetical protein
MTAAMSDDEKRGFNSNGQIASGRTIRVVATCSKNLVGKLFLFLEQTAVMLLHYNQNDRVVALF